MNYYSTELLARDRLDQFAREARAGDLRPIQPGIEPFGLATVVGLVRRLTRKPRLESPSASAAAGPQIA